MIFIGEAFEGSGGEAVVGGLFMPLPNQKLKC